MSGNDPRDKSAASESAPLIDKKVTPIRAKRPCPECGRPTTREAYPFCSTRCKEIDLNRWFSGAYAIPVTEEEEAAENNRSDDDGER